MEIKTGIKNMDLTLIHDYLCNESYWAKGISVEVVRKSLGNSFCLGVFIENKQVAFARLITDYATFAYLGDVFVVDKWRKQGISKLLLRYICELDWVQSLRRFMLATNDAHGLYSQFGFTPLSKSEHLMEVLKPAIYERKDTV